MLREGPTTNGMTKHEAKRLACILAYWLATIHASVNMPEPMAFTRSASDMTQEEREEFLEWKYDLAAYKRAIMEQGKQFLRDNPDFGAGEDSTPIVRIIGSFPFPDDDS